MTANITRIYHPGSLMAFFEKHKLPFAVGRPIEGPDLAGFYVRMPQQTDVTKLVELRAELRSTLGVSAVYFVFGIEPSELAILSPRFSKSETRPVAGTSIPVGLSETIPVDSKQLIDGWIKEIDEFSRMSYDAYESLRRHYGSQGLTDEYDSSEREQKGCDAAVEILRELKVPEMAPEQDIQEQAIQVLIEQGPIDPKQRTAHMRGIQWALDVVRGCPEKHYNRYHPKQIRQEHVEYDREIDKDFSTLQEYDISTELEDVVFIEAKWPGDPDPFVRKVLNQTLYILTPKKLYGVKGLVTHFRHTPDRTSADFLTYNPREKSDYLGRLNITKDNQVSDFSLRRVSKEEGDNFRKQRRERKRERIELDGWKYAVMRVGDDTFLQRHDRILIQSKNGEIRSRLFLGPHEGGCMCWMGLISGYEKLTPAQKVWSLVKNMAGRDSKLTPNTRFLIGLANGDIVSCPFADIKNGTLIMADEWERKYEKLEKFDQWSADQNGGLMTHSTRLFYKSVQYRNSPFQLEFSLQETVLQGPVPGTQLKKFEMFEYVSEYL